MTKTLKEKTAHAIAWSFVDKFGQQGLNFIVGIILARYFLSPSEYGLVGMIAIFNALGYILIDSGFSNALIRKQDVSQTDLSSVFYFNIGISLVFYIVLFFCAPFIALFYSQPVLTSLIRIMSLGIPLSSLALIQITLLSKSINFKLLAHTNLIALFCSGSLSLFLAWKGFGVWVLAIQPLSNTIVRNICLWSVSSWHPSAVYSRQSIKELWGYSSKLLASSTLSIVFNNIYALLIGKFYPLQEVGYYTQANKYSEIPYVTIMPAIQAAMYPVMAQESSDEERLKSIFRKTNRVSAFIIFPILLGLSAIAKPLIYTLLGEKWLVIAPYMQILCVGYCFLSFASLYTHILYIKGLSLQALRFNLLHKSLLLLSIIFTFRFGVVALLFGWSIMGALYTLIITIYAGKKIKYIFSEQLKDIIPYFTLALIMSLGLFLLSLFIKNNTILLLLQLTIGALFYLSAVYLLGSKIFREVIEIVKNKTIKA